MTAPTSPATMHKGRSEALADGVFAIVLTLLVLELKVPDDIAQLGEHLSHHKSTFVGYFITFAIGGMFWYLHHALFQFVQHVTPRMVLANLVFLGAVSLLPFTMACYSRKPGQELPTQLYLGNFCVIALVLALLMRLAQSSGAIAADVAPATLWPLRRRILALPIASALGLALSFVAPQYGVYAFVAVMLGVRLWARVART